MEALPKEFLICQDRVDRPSKAAQTFGFNLMLGFHVAEAFCSSGISRFQFLENLLFFRVMAAVGIDHEVLADHLLDVVVGSLAAIAYLEFSLLDETKFFDGLIH